MSFLCQHVDTDSVHQFSLFTQYFGVEKYCHIGQIDLSFRHDMILGNIVNHTMFSVP